MKKKSGSHPLGFFCTTWLDPASWADIVSEASSRGAVLSVTFSTWRNFRSPRGHKMPYKMLHFAAWSACLSQIQQNFIQFLKGTINPWFWGLIFERIVRSIHTWGASASALLIFSAASWSNAFFLKDPTGSTHQQKADEKLMKSWHVTKKIVSHKSHIIKMEVLLKSTKNTTSWYSFCQFEAWVYDINWL